MKLTYVLNISIVYSLPLEVAVLNTYFSVRKKPVLNIFFSVIDRTV